MMKKAILFAVVLLVLATANAYAVPVTINIDELYDWGRLYTYAAGSYTTTNSNLPYYGSGVDTPVGTVVAANTMGIADGQEDSWGIGSIASIKTFPDNDPIFLRSAGQELTMMFYGFDDDYLSSPGITGETSLLSKGGHVSVYLDATPDFTGINGTSNRTGSASYAGATDGVLVLDLAPIDLTGLGHTMDSDFKFLTQSGGGAMYLSTTGLGLWDTLYDTNTQQGGSDFSLTFTSRTNTNPTIGNWVVRGDAGGEGNVVPEPASMILMGLGLLGARLRRRKA